MNALYYGDNLEVLREHVADESIDLIYLDPPFNSKRNYNILFKSPSGEESDAQITAFEDTWKWGEQAEREYDEVISSHNPTTASMVAAMRSFLGESDTMVYLAMMANRLLELHRVLKQTGTVYLHCDPTASHYLKILMDSIFGPKQFRNEIVWAYRGGGRPKKDFGRKHDIIFRYSKTDNYYFYPDNVRIPYQAEGLGRTDDAMWGRHKGTDKVYRPNPLGKVPEDWWPIDALNANAPERLGYPTQKPLVLLERIVKVSSKDGDMVLDPFCGCGTTLHASEVLKRQWTGIDITHLAIALIESRLREAFPAIQFQTRGTPRTLDGAIDLARRDKHQFELWACSLVSARPAQAGKKGADRGIDGIKFFTDINPQTRDRVTRKIIVSVKGGENVGVSMIRDLVGTMQRSRADLAWFVTLTPPTQPMIREAAAAGLYKAGDGKSYPKVQILTVEGLLKGTQRAEYFDISPEDINFRKAQAEKQRNQSSLF